jgi:hypothetical protein
LAYLIGKPADWKLNVQDLVNHGNEGKAAIRASLKELKSAGYAQFVRIRFNGVFTEGVWKISDSPIFSPQTEFPHVEKPDVVNRHITKNECNKNDLTKIESKEAKESSSQASDEINPVWKPSQRTKEEQLRAHRNPKNFPSQEEFESFMESNELGVINYRPNLYSELCLNKWRMWKENYNRWVLIVDWKKWVIGLNETISNAQSGEF